MCELHPHRCPTCRRTWTEQRRLASCDSMDPAAPRCPPSLCMWVGNPRRPARAECAGCRDRRERAEDRRQDEAEEAAAAAAEAEAEARKREGRRGEGEGEGQGEGEGEGEGTVGR
ncbi:hypothetical protein GGR56DRAFT_675276 [Xylariaceae sp. FL0804]|nr:hypothetical protein GGR56DRAFT_675276 [Xylariaceae sp. FL0804]